MRLLFTYPFCGLGGVETSILNKIEALRKADIEGHVLFGDFYGSSGQTLSVDPRVTVTNNVSEVRALLGQGFDAISVVDHPDFVDLLDALQATPIAIAESHTSFPHALQRLYRNLNHPRIAAVVVPSRFNRGLVNDVLHDSKEIVVIRNPVDGTRFRPSPPQTEEALPLQITGPVVLWVGRLENEKNPSELIEIGKELLVRRPDIRVLLVGDAWSTEEYVAYQSRLLAAAPSEWREHFVFQRSVPYAAMPDLYARVAQTGGCLVSTSLFESAPMTFIEAMSCGCPVVSTSVGGAPSWSLKNGPDVCMSRVTSARPSPRFSICSTKKNVRRETR